MDRSHIVQVPSWFLTARFVQIGLAVLILLLNAIGLGLLSVYTGPGYGVFTCIATILICGYYIISTKSKPDFYNYIAVLVLEIFMELWWLSTFSVLAWVASVLAIFNDDLDLYAYDYDYGHAHGAYICFAIAAAASAIQWVLVTVTLITFAVHMVRHNKNRQPTVTYVTPVKMENGIGHQQPEAQVPVYVQNGQYVAA